MEAKHPLGPLRLHACLGLRGRNRSAVYWHENAWRNPPPPAAACPLVESAMIVPAATLFAAVAVAVLPAADPVETERIDAPAVHVALAVDGFTEKSDQVVLAPEYE
jgi:hypothetical protein